MGDKNNRGHFRRLGVTISIPTRLFRRSRDKTPVEGKTRDYEQAGEWDMLQYGKKGWGEVKN